MDNSTVYRHYYVRTKGNDSWLSARTEQILPNGVITEAVSVSEIHAWAKQRRETDPDCFIASLR